MSSANGRWIGHSRMIRWGPFDDDAQRMLSYFLTPPPQAYGPAVFTGRLSVDGVDTEIDGDIALTSERIFADGFD
jgi:hypothetical protein